MYERLSNFITENDYVSQTRGVESLKGRYKVISKLCEEDKKKVYEYVAEMGEKSLEVKEYQIVLEKSKEDKNFVRLKEISLIPVGKAVGGESCEGSVGDCGRMDLENLEGIDEEVEAATEDYYRADTHLATLIGGLQGKVSEEKSEGGFEEQEIVGLDELMNTSNMMIEEEEEEIEEEEEAIAERSEQLEEEETSETAGVGQAHQIRCDTHMTFTQFLDFFYPPSPLCPKFIY